MSNEAQVLSGFDLVRVSQLAAQLRVDSIRCSTSAGSGHPTSSMSAADLLAVLMSQHLRYDWDHPADDRNDHLIFSKGHASPLLYSVYKAAGVVSDEELMTGYRRFGSRLEGHPTPVLPWVDVATGSLGQGLPDGVGVALAGKYLDRLPYRVWVLCGDSEMAEGSIWEALDKASYYGLSNLIAMVDVNRLGQRGPTELQWDLDSYARRAAAFGARVLEINGHDLAEIGAAFTAAEDGSGGQPTVILARTRSQRTRTSGWEPSPTCPPRLTRPTGTPRPRRPGRRRTRWVPRWLPVRRMATRWSHWAGTCPGSWPSTVRSATPRSPWSSPRRTPGATSRCSSPSSRWSRPR